MAALLKKHCSINADLIKSSGGVFEVVVDGKLLYSKKATGEFPDEMKLVITSYSIHYTKLYEQHILEETSEGCIIFNGENTPPGHAGLHKEISIAQC